MRVGVYIDGFNLYYGGRGLCGKGAPGWRWLDVRALAARLVANHSAWTGATIERVIYCTAVISGADNPVGNREQDVYLRALRRSQTTDHIELGNYVHRVARAPLATPDRNGRPILAQCTLHNGLIPPVPAGGGFFHAGRPPTHFQPSHQLAALTFLVLQEPVDRLLSHAQLGRNPRRTPTSLHQPLSRPPATLPRVSRFTGKTLQVGMSTHQLAQRLTLIHTDPPHVLPNGPIPTRGKTRLTPRPRESRLP